MSDSDHPIVQWINDYNADPEAHSVDAIAHEFAKLSDPQRVESLQRVKTWFDAPASLPKQAQLMQLSRQMENVHQKLRRVGR